MILIGHARNNDTIDSLAWLFHMWGYIKAQTAYFLDLKYPSSHNNIVQLTQVKKLPSIIVSALDHQFHIFERGEIGRLLP